MYLFPDFPHIDFPLLSFSGKLQKFLGRGFFQQEAVLAGCHDWCDVAQLAAYLNFLLTIGSAGFGCYGPGVVVVVVVTFHG